MSPTTDPVVEINPPGKTQVRSIQANSGGSLRDALDDFLQLKHARRDRGRDRVVVDQPKMVSRFYDVVTKFYEYGWGQSFHFAPRRSREGLHAAQRRQEAGVAEVLKLEPGMRVADIGCGVGGPAINIAKESGASITGLNLNAYQIERCRKSALRAGLGDTCDFLLANYLDVPLPDGSFDAAYSFEAICHTPTRDVCFRELYRLLKPGGEVALTEWAIIRWRSPDSRMTKSDSPTPPAT